MNRSTIKSIAAIAFTGLSSALVFGFRTTDAPVVAGGASANSTTGGATNRSASSTTATPAPATGGSGTAGLYADGTWTGAAVQEPWGAFEVQVVIADGRIANVNLVESPADRHSTRINNVAVPLLTQAAIASQGTQVDTVSGATWTSESYAASLQSALDQARAA